VEQKGFSGWMNRKMQEAQKNADTRQEALKEQRAAKSGKGGSTSSKAVTSDANGEVIDVETRPVKRGTSYQDRVDAATKFSTRVEAEALDGSVAAGADPNPNSKASKKARRAKGTTG
jgi:hypothetical protein